MSKYEIFTTSDFDRGYRKLIKYNSALERSIKDVIETLRLNPFAPSLRTHKVNARKYGISFSSRVTGDIRIIWDFDEHHRQPIILALAIGGHSGQHNVYN